VEYSKEDIERIVQRIAFAVNRNDYTVETNENRQKNNDFRDKYGIKSEWLKNALLDLRVDDFSATVQNVKPGYEDEKLYIFGPKYQLYQAGEESAEEVVAYVKVNIIERSIDDYVVVVSFHEAEQAMDYAFK